MLYRLRFSSLLFLCCGESLVIPEYEDEYPVNVSRLALVVHEGDITSVRYFLLLLDGEQTVDGGGGVTFLVLCIGLPEDIERVGGFAIVLLAHCFEGVPITVFNVGEDKPFAHLGFLLPSF